MGEPEIAVIGAGSWGTTLANLLANKGITVTLWIREREVFHQIKEEKENNGQAAQNSNPFFRCAVFFGNILRKGFNFVFFRFIS